MPDLSSPAPEQNLDPHEPVIRIVADLAEIDATAWDALVDAQPSATPFMRHACLAALQASNSASDDAGWTAQFLTLSSGDDLLAACPLYRKTHSYGEYEFLCRLAMFVQGP